MQEINHKKGKIYYSMGEVAEMFDVNPSLLRFWEQEFDILKPHRNKKGNRLFTPQDVDNIKLIYHLLKERNMKIDVARKYLKENREEVDRDARITEHLMNIKAILLEIKQDLKYDGQVVDDDVADDMAEDAVAQGGGASPVAQTVAQRETESETPESDGCSEDVQRAGEDIDQGAELERKPPFEEQMLFEVAVPLELLQGDRDVEDEGFESAKTAFLAGDDGGEHVEPVQDEKPKMQIVEQTLF